MPAKKHTKKKKDVVNKKLPPKEIHRRQKVKDIREILVEPKTVIHQLPPEVREKIYQSAEAREELQRQLEKNRALNEARRKELERGEKYKNALERERRIREDMEDRVLKAWDAVPWPPGSVYSGPTGRDLRPKTPQNIQQAYMEELAKDKWKLQQGLKAHEQYIENLRAQIHNRRGPISFLKDLVGHPIDTLLGKHALRKELFTAKRHLKYLKKHWPKMEKQWNRMIEDTRGHLNKLFKEFQAEEKSREFVAKKLPLYIQEFNTAINNYLTLKKIFSYELMGRSSVKTVKRKGENVGVGIPKELRTVFKRVNINPFKPRTWGKRQPIEKAMAVILEQLEENRKKRVQRLERA